jgi:hypothetical protein
MATELLGMEWPREVIEVLLVPVALLLVSLLWPSWQRWRRQREFLHLLSRELREAKPAKVAEKAGRTWTWHLDKQFLHTSMMPGGAASDASLLLSLSPNLAYELNQMWSAYAAAEDDPAVKYAQQWCSYLKSVCKHIDRRILIRPPNLTNTVWLPWHCLLEKYYPRKPGVAEDQGHHPTDDHDPGSHACAGLDPLKE